MFLVATESKPDILRQNGLVASPMEATQELTDLDSQSELDKGWTVIVWNDPINLMDYVAFVFQKVFGYSKSKSNKLMMDVHQKGRANVFAGDRSKAESYAHKLHGFGLWATMERAT